MELKDSCFRTIYCGNIRPHVRVLKDKDKRAILDKNGEKITKQSEICNALLKIYQEPAEFREIFICQTCGCHWLIEKKLNGAATAFRLPEGVRVKAKPLPVLWVGAKPKEKKNA